MAFFALLLTFATALLASPRRPASRQAGTRRSLPMQQDDGPTNQTDATYSTNWAGTVLVGIDGDTCDTAILQTGVDFIIHALTGAIDYDGISGDVVTLTVTATTKHTDTAVIENTTTGQTVSKTITSTSALCEENAEWIVENYEEGDALANFADFGTVTFTDAEATTPSDSRIGPSDATIIDIR
ncbi:concanavalin A-like lectin/glucanase [Fistulina hepatica ATCC 64428]|uniref:Concanavalin A-like lectin/glucanase n=1 Tax=Fistulina hepatica ATCC 64428 TaxID=1128425 RepID=A0A0D7AQT4_9AGAR|nr:concanavalin A-like lectin/glucanase [Fistulina hepatica ATCC 64428]